jgi:uncharacterized membrane protein
VRSPSRWRPWIAFFVAISAFGVSFYLTLAHYDSGAVQLACSENGAINCAKVTTSPESVILGVPVALIGLIYYAVMVGLNLPFMWRSRYRSVAPLRLAGVIAGIGMVVYLVSAELLTIKAICIYCTAVHALTFILFMLVVTGWDDATALSAADRSARPSTDRHRSVGVGRHD